MGRGAWGLIEWDSLCGDVMRYAEQAKAVAGRCSQGEAALAVQSLGRNISRALENVDQKLHICVLSKWVKIFLHRPADGMAGWAAA